MTLNLGGRTFTVTRFNRASESPWVKVTTVWNGITLEAGRTGHGLGIDYPSVTFRTPEQVKDFARATELLGVVAEREYLGFIVSLPDEPA